MPKAIVGEVARFGNISVQVQVSLERKTKETVVPFMTQTTANVRFNHAPSLVLSIYNPVWDVKNSLLILNGEKFKFQTSLGTMIRNIQKVSPYKLQTYGDEPKLFVTDKDMHIAAKFVCGDMIVTPEVYETHYDNTTNPGEKGLGIVLNNGFISTIMSMEEACSMLDLIEHMDLFLYGNQLYNNYMLTLEKQTVIPKKQLNNHRANVFNQKTPSKVESTLKINKPDKVKDDMEGL